MSRKTYTQTFLLVTDESRSKAPEEETPHQSSSQVPQSSETSLLESSAGPISSWQQPGPMQSPSLTTCQGASIPGPATSAARDVAMYHHYGESQTATDATLVKRKRYGHESFEGKTEARRPRVSPLENGFQDTSCRTSPGGQSIESPSLEHSATSSSTVVEPSEPTSPASTEAHPPPSVQMNQYGLHIRQQPASARAGPPGRDRRPIDPPCILQLMITDFDAYSAQDISVLKDHSFQVYCALRPIQQPRKGNDLSDDWKAEMSETQKYLIGEKMGIAFFSPADPDPEHAPRHPSSRIWQADSSARPESKQTPAVFFVFSDLSVRRAGRYRLEFTLIEMDSAAILDPGGIIPVHARIMSDIFECYSAKEFPSIKPSTKLLKGLHEQGCSRIPIKKGAGERRAHGPSNDGDDE